MLHLRSGHSLCQQLESRSDADPSLQEEIHAQFRALSEVAYGESESFEDIDKFDLSKVEVDTPTSLNPFRSLQEARTSLVRCIWAVFISQNSRDDTRELPRCPGT